MRIAIETADENLYHAQIPHSHILSGTVRPLMNLQRLLRTAGRRFDRIALLPLIATLNIQGTNSIITWVLGELGSTGPPPLKDRPSYIVIPALLPASKCLEVGARMLICVHSERTYGPAGGLHWAMISRLNLLMIPPSTVAAARTCPMTGDPNDLHLLPLHMGVSRRGKRAAPTWIRACP